jgi:hypothetical protein
MSGAAAAATCLAIKLTPSADVDTHVVVAGRLSEGGTALVESSVRRVWGADDSYVP